MITKERNITEKRRKLNSRFHQLITLKSFDADEKKALVKTLSGGHFTSSKFLTDAQLQEGIDMMQEDRAISIRKMRAKAINKARELGMVTGGLMDINWDGLNAFCTKTFKVPFYKLTFDQLRSCVTALEKTQDHKLNKAIKNLLL